MTFHETPMDDTDEPEVELPPIEPTPVDGAQALPDDVKNGDPTEPTETYE